MKEDLRIARLLMVLASFWPLFALWGIKGPSQSTIDHRDWAIGCALLVVIPNLVLFLRYSIASVNRDTRTIRIVSAKDQREHVIVYLFAVLLPLFDANQNSVADQLAVIFALFFVIAVFYSLNLHYLNLAFSFRGFRCYSVVTEVLGADLKPGKELLVVLSPRAELTSGDEITAIRVSNSVLVE